MFHLVSDKTIAGIFAVTELYKDRKRPNLIVLENYLIAGLGSKRKSNYRNKKKRCRRLTIRRSGCRSLPIW